MKRHHCILFLAAWMALSAAATAAPPPAPAPAPPGDDPVAQNVFPPELIMRHGGEIGLDAEQRTAIKDAVLQAQTKFLGAQWEAQEETTKLVHLLQARPVDEKAVLSQADRLMDLERQIKKTQLSLLVRLKNLLTPAQQARLADLRRAAD
jgi:Spy/CpxP family protein refolding chaperone